MTIGGIGRSGVLVGSIASGLGMMSGTVPQIEWYIARDGTRHGPISDVEMHKFVELGHLKPTDLVWCQSFSEWQLASQVFGPGVGQPQAPSPVSPQVSPPSQASTPAPAAAPAPVVAAYEPAPVQPLASASSAAGAPVQAPHPGYGPGHPVEPQPAPSLNEDAAWAMAMRAVLQEPAAKAQPAPVQQSLQQRLQARDTAPEAMAPVSVAQPSQSYGYPGYQGTGDGRLDRPVAAEQPGYGAGSYAPAPYSPAGYGGHPDEAGYAHGQEHDYSDEPVAEAPRRRDWISTSAVVAAVLLILGGLGYVGWQNRSVVDGAAAIGSAIKAKVSNSTSSEAFRGSPYDAPGETRDLIDVSLQKTAIWRALKRDFPDWYGERVGEIEAMRTSNRDEKVISRYIADVIVTLRRRNALAALQSSPEHLKGMARMFMENLKQLASRDGATCFAFITFGEANPIALDLSRTPAFAETLQRQMISIFEAIVDGKAHQTVHPNTQPADYDLLTKELMARGWSSADLATFSDPKKLSSSPPEKVCKLVQEWFATHLALTDNKLQARLLAESLRPLVGG